MRGDTGPANHAGGLLTPTYSVLTDATDYPALNNSGSNPTLLSQYCNGSRVPPELGSMGYQVPPGISDATVPNPIFNLTPAATVDEGNNWINIAWGPLSLTNPAITAGSTGYNVPLANYGPAAGSPVINYIASTAPTYPPAPSTDFYGNPRKGNNHVDAGAVEYASAAGAVASVTPTSLTFSAVAGTTSASQPLTLSNTGGADLTGIGVAVAGSFSRPGGGAGGTCGGTLTSGSTCTINIVFSPSSTATGTLTGTVTITGSVTVTGSPVQLTGTVTQADASGDREPKSAGLRQLGDRHEQQCA